MRCIIFCLFGLLAIGHSASPPVFPDQYTAHGVLLLPYAEIREPFAAYYDGKLNRSRIDYYGDLMITLQKSPAAEKDPDNQSGSLYTIVWEGDSTGKAKRVCFKSGGEDDEPVTAQSLIPNLDGFTRIGLTRCPIESIHELEEGSIQSKLKALTDLEYNVNVKHPSSCELWRKKVAFGEKTSTYSFWYKKNPKTGENIPVTYEMAGFNSLTGSHYDHYVLHYTNFRDGLLSEDLFNINERYSNCGPFPGPGDTKRRGRKLLFNPMKAYIENDRSAFDKHFNEFKQEHNKKYDTLLEVEERRKIFLDNTRFISAMNTRNPTFQLAVNHLADKSEDELDILRGRKVTLKSSNGGLPFKSNKMYSSSGDALPDNWDWRLLGAVNPVKDQASCGSCWSFGSTGTLEGAYFVKTGRLVRLSEQQLVDCSWDQGNNGCSGGEDFRVYKYIMAAGGISLDEEYGHYLGVDGKCHANDVSKDKKIEITGFVNVTQYSVEDLKKALYENGPVTIGINAGVKTFSFYSHGVYNDPKCVGDEDHINHQVLLVGYGSLRGNDYWLVKNSWSTYWGNDGYILIAQKDNICGVTTMATYPLIKA